ncbi:hypothetical protein G7084_06935 [Weissella coleopterorum]|uniref:Uncharacterized protein n=1 Tax=Weissella coleopterorum TaxID=2714949 RepID=A0A6G8B1E9_9LACO|nr:hypothetical protein [Weissella coleopterorum]QIL51052.1 hypothetical protein G7084_06935 [Weissella coleopterorum]
MENKFSLIHYDSKNDQEVQYSDAEITDLKIAQLVHTIASTAEDFVIITPNVPINDSLFMQIMALSDDDMHLEIGYGDYNYICYKNIAKAIVDLQNYHNEMLPELTTWQKFNLHKKAFSFANNFKRLFHRDKKDSADKYQSKITK